MKACGEGIDIQQLFKGERHPYEQVFKIRNIPDMQDYLEQLIKQFNSKLTDMRNFIQNNTIDAIKNILETI